ncbi:DeoR/GlpR family DNA-binding transcription regulator [Catenisphaera adipataccumulans]|jgi:DeoR family fructose operon transcriptional repressor|uniref:DeoR/GlpR family transcriptional regulator of sugar metabolism n=1 Tax=Catenisphaera adipataccumulans TaxID=700500 RepID=A0A7W8CW81_9FIRM|nr:DeoR/GlpR family DNA-binding transcription regulator [Catenisphaera adipataccumulans]MBB5182728.1 DeoR/GlpR family transcriptional regulator of sugar metabolism [Catenisphaera adipataccumulans]
MIAKERQDLILQKIHADGVVYLNELAKEFNVSACTIRRDFEKLEKLNFCRRVHGGAVKVQNPQHSLEMTDLHMDQRITMHMDEKKALCQRVAQMIDNGDCVFIDGGTTFMYIMEYLKDKKITVVSHNMLLKNDDAYQCELYILGGRNSSKYQMNLGPMVLDDLSYFHFDKVFLGAAGFALENMNFYTAELETAKVKQQAIKQGQECYVVLDSSKIGVYGFYAMTNLADLNGLVTTQNIKSVKEKLIWVPMPEQSSEV